MPPLLTCGNRIEASHGHRVELAGDGDVVARLAKFLRSESPSAIWWAPCTWRGDHRTNDTWEGSWAAVLDVDYQDDWGKHAAMPAPARKEIEAHMIAGKLSGNIAHLTPRGFRLVAAFEDGVVTDNDLFCGATRGFAATAAEELRALGLHTGDGVAGFRVDSAAFKLSQFFFLANTAVPIPSRNGTPQPRGAAVHALRPAQYSAYDLAARATPADDGQRNGAGSANSSDFAEAAKRWVADHPRSYPEPGSGTCPTCGHHKCFGQLANDPTRWSCFSANHHEHTQGWTGQEGQGNWFGNSLDLEAHERGCKPIDVLRHDGYLASEPARGSRQGRQGASSRPTSQPRVHPPAIAAPHDAFALTDLGNAERFVQEYGHVVRNTAALGWLGWDRRRWLTGDQAVPLVHEHAKELVRKLHMEAANAAGNRQLHDELLKSAKRASNKPGFMAMLELAAREGRINVSASDLDSDPLLFNCPNGTVDLRTGRLLDHDPARLITHLAGVEFHLEARCPVWMKTLDEIFAGPDQAQVIDFVQRALGYTLTGLTREEIFFLLWGDGRNGKGTLLETIKRVMGTYARTATMELFLTRRNDSSKQFEIADLAGVRMVVASEASAGRAFDTALLKSWTGGDTRKGCHKHKPFFEYRPTDKLWLLVNDKPKVASWDAAFQERCRLIPFENSFTAEQGNLDPDRKGKLMEELPGVLAWMVEGCLRYQRDGLAAPERVKAAVLEYRSESTRVADFLAGAYLPVQGSSLSQAKVYGDYRDWARKQGLDPVPDNRFGQHLREAGYDTKKGKSGMIVLNIGMRENSAVESQG